MLPGTIIIDGKVKAIWDGPRELGSASPRVETRPCHSRKGKTMADR